MEHLKSKALEPQLMRLLLFDLWISNEDRNSNYNLLLNLRNEKGFVLIDHEMAFNTCNALKNGLAPVTVEDTLVNTLLFEKVFSNFKTLPKLITSTMDESRNWNKLIYPKIETWLDECPSEWIIDKKLWIHFLQKDWLSDRWMQLVHENYVTLLQHLATQS